VERGFDFLGQNVRRYPNGELLIKPSKKNVKVFLDGIRKIIKARLGLSAAELIDWLSPKIRVGPAITGTWPMKPTSKNAKGITWRTRFGVLDHFVFLFLQRGFCPACNLKMTRITGWRLHYRVPRVKGGSPRQKTAFCFIQSVTTGFTANVFSYHIRVSLKEAFEGPEPDDGKLSRPVLRGPDPTMGAGYSVNGARLSTKGRSKSAPQE
jgi:hypothetical protein